MPEEKIVHYGDSCKRLNQGTRDVTLVPFVYNTTGKIHQLGMGFLKKVAEHAVEGEALLCKKPSNRHHQCAESRLDQSWYVHVHPYSLIVGFLVCVLFLNRLCSSRQHGCKPGTQEVFITTEELTKTVSSFAY